MSVDMLSNMLSSIKNAALVGKESVEVVHTNVNESVAKVLKESGFLEEVSVFKEKGSPSKGMKLTISMVAGAPRIKDIKRVSRPGGRVYMSSSKIRPVLSGYGISVISTSRGIMSDGSARKKKLGGEVLCEVW